MHRNSIRILIVLSLFWTLVIISPSSLIFQNTKSAAPDMPAVQSGKYSTEDYTFSWGESSSLSNLMTTNVKSIPHSDDMIFTSTIFDSNQSTFWSYFGRLTQKGELKWVNVFNSSQNSIYDFVIGDKIYAVTFHRNESGILSAWLKSFDLNSGSLGASINLFDNRYVTYMKIICDPKNSQLLYGIFSFNTGGFDPATTNVMKINMTSNSIIWNKTLPAPDSYGYRYITSLSYSETNNYLYAAVNMGTALFGPLNLTLWKINPDDGSATNKSVIVEGSNYFGAKDLHVVGNYVYILMYNSTPDASSEPPQNYAIYKTDLDLNPQFYQEFDPIQRYVFYTSFYVAKNGTSIIFSGLEYNNYYETNDGNSNNSGIIVYYELPTNGKYYEFQKLILYGRTNGDFVIQNGHYDPEHNRYYLCGSANFINDNGNWTAIIAVFSDLVVGVSIAPEHFWDPFLDKNNWIALAITALVFFTLGALIFGGKKKSKR